jgi:hypothetical protein
MATKPDDPSTGSGLSADGRIEGVKTVKTNESVEGSEMIQLRPVDSGGESGISF